MWSSLPLISYSSSQYVAVTYWTFYVHDDKAALRDKFGNDKIEFTNPEEHQSDFESVTILINSSGAQWIGASQHLGGELRPWNAVSTQDGTHPDLYVAEGAHSIYFTNSNKYGSIGILGQEQHLNANSDSTQVNQAMISSIDPSFARHSPGVYTDLTGNASSWSQSGVRNEQTYRNDQYTVKRLTGEEPWQEYEGSFIDSTLSQMLIGDAIPPAQRDRWKNPGDWMEENLVSYESQVDPELGWQLHGIDKGTFNQSTATVNVKICNVGASEVSIFGTP